MITAVSVSWEGSRVIGIDSPSPSPGLFPSLLQLQSENEEIREQIMSELESIARLRVDEGEEWQGDNQ